MPPHRTPISRRRTPPPARAPSPRLTKVRLQGALIGGRPAGASSPRPHQGSPPRRAHRRSTRPGSFSSSSSSFASKARSTVSRRGLLHPASRSRREPVPGRMGMAMARATSLTMPAGTVGSTTPRAWQGASAASPLLPQVVLQLAGQHVRLTHWLTIWIYCANMSLR